MNAARQFVLSTIIHTYIVTFNKALLMFDVHEMQEVYFYSYPTEGNLS